ncbi:MAG: DnaJ domain-containing protein [Pseudomonadota bacterium]|nr:DnaJ domain-containing protein [Pseudomonadota bacterium]
MNSFGNNGKIFIPERQLLQSCRILFGPEVDITRQFLGYLQPSGVKTAYRKLVMETHPDRAYQLGVEEAVLESRFKEVNRAYEEVYAYIQDPDRYVLTTPRIFYRPQNSSPAGGARPSQHYYRGTIPPRRMLLGQYLYYSGVISMGQMWDAVVWQKIRRPRLGEIAGRLRWLSPRDIHHILRYRKRGELFGEYALRSGMLSFYQVLVLLGRQKSLQPRIGEYFVGQGIVTPKRLDAVEAALKAHNRRHWFKK